MAFLAHFKVTKRLRAEGGWNLGQKGPDSRWRKKLVEIQDEVSGFRGGGRFWFGIWGSWELEDVFEASVLSGPIWDSGYHCVRIWSQKEES